MNFKNFVTYFLFIYLNNTITEAWVNYQINVLAIQAEYVNNDLVILHKLEVKKHNRTYIYIISNATSIVTLYNLTVTAQGYRQSNGRYKEYLPEITTQVCAILQEGPSSEHGFVGKMITTLKKPLLEMLRAEGQKMPLHCPIPADNYHMIVHVDEEKFPSFFMPEGKWMAKADVHANNGLHFAKVKIFFEIVNFHSEKQKRMG